jgi:hypothetical protein
MYIVCRYDADGPLADLTAAQAPAAAEAAAAAAAGSGHVSAVMPTAQLIGIFNNSSVAKSGSSRTGAKVLVAA